MAEKYCINHEKNPATVHCFQCHKPICQQCVMVTPAGSFCSSTCSVTYKEMQAHLHGGKPVKKGGGLGVAVKLVAVAAVILAGIHVAARYAGVEALRAFDLIGKFLLPSG